MKTNLAHDVFIKQYAEEPESPKDTVYAYVPMEELAQEIYLTIKCVQVKDRGEAKTFKNIANNFVVPSFSDFLNYSKSLENEVNYQISVLTNSDI